MDSMLTIKLPPEMKAALKKVSKRQFISVSAATKQAIERYLDSHNVDWRQEKTKKGKS